MSSGERTYYLESLDDKAVSAVLSSDNGVLFITSLIERCGINSQSFRIDESDTSAMIFREGRRSIGLELLQMIYSNPVLEKSYHEAVQKRNEARRLDHLADLENELAII